MVKDKEQKEEKSEIIQVYNPTDKELKAQEWAYENFNIMWDVNNKPYEQFNGNTLAKYLEESRKTLNLMAKPRLDGRSNVKSVAPLNKLMAILARIALKRPTIDVTATTRNNIVDRKRGEILKDLWIWSNENIERDEDGDTEYFFEAFDGASDGTVLVYEGFDNQTHNRKKIKDYDPDTGEVKWEKEEFTTNICYSQTIMPEDFFIWNPYLRLLQKQPKVAWRTIYDKAHFNYEFKGYKKAKYVLPGGHISAPFDTVYYKTYWKDRIENNQIEVLRVYDRFEDRMVIIANGVVLSDSPLPWKHKLYPFGKTIFSPFAGGQFFWGMSLAFKLKGDKEALETLYNLGIEQAKLAVNPPILTTAENETEDNMILPGRQIIVDDPKQFEQLIFKSPDQSYFNFLKVIGENIDLASVDPVSSGINMQDVTARGQVIAEENARKLLGIFNRLMESLVMQKAKLRISNIIQFLLVPGAEFRVEGVMVEGPNNQPTQGIREMKVVGDEGEEAETPSQLQMIEDMAKVQGVNLERLNFKASYLQQIRYSVKVVGESAYQQGKSLRISLETEKLYAVFQLFPNIFQSASELFFKNLMKVYEDDPQPYLDAIAASIQANNQQIQAAGGQQMGAMTAGLSPGSFGQKGNMQAQMANAQANSKVAPRKLVSEMTGHTGGKPELKKLVGAG